MTALIFFSMLGFNSMAQQKPLPTADNSIHDRMAMLRSKSNNVSLPDEITERINGLNKDNPYKVKIIYAQTSSLKVLYNKALTKEDKIFFGEQLLKKTSAMITPIHNDIKKILAGLK